METRYNYNQDRLNAMNYIDGFEAGHVTFLYSSIEAKVGEIVKIVKKKDELIIYPTKVASDAKEFKILKIKLKDIEYFKTDGEKYREQKISGGGSTGIDVGGAILGSIIAGAPGMIIGGQRKVQEITTTTITHDTRKTKFSYFEGNQRKTLYFALEDFEYFQDTIPDKEYDIVSTKRKNKFVEEDASSTKNKTKTVEKEETSTKQKLKELKELLDEGLIDKDEFDERKKKLLDEI